MPLVHLRRQWPQDQDPGDARVGVELAHDRERLGLLRVGGQPFVGVAATELLREPLDPPLVGLSRVLVPDEYRGEARSGAVAVNGGELEGGLLPEFGRNGRAVDQACCHPRESTSPRPPGGLTARLGRAGPAGSRPEGGGHLPLRGVAASEEAGRAAGLVDVDVLQGRGDTETGHGHQVAAEDDEPARSGVRPNLADREGEALGALKSAGSWDSDSGVFAMQIGRRSSPSRSQATTVCSAPRAGARCRPRRRPASRSSRSSR